MKKPRYYPLISKLFFPLFFSTVVASTQKPKEDIVLPEWLVELPEDLEVNTQLDSDTIYPQNGGDEKAAKKQILENGFHEIVLMFFI